MQIYGHVGLKPSEIPDARKIEREFARGILLGASCGLLLSGFVLAISYYFDLAGARLMIKAIVG
jgi:hypothetical protein